MERRDVQNVVKPAPRGQQGGFQIGKRKANLRLEVGFGRTILAASDLTRDKQKVVRSYRSRIAVGFVESVPACRKYCFALIHAIVPSGFKGMASSFSLLDIATSLDNPGTPRM